MIVVRLYTRAYAAESKVVNSKVRIYTTSKWQRHNANATNIGVGVTASGCRPNIEAALSLRRVRSTISVGGCLLKPIAAFGARSLARPVRQHF